MRELPILFSAPMVRASLADRKTHTRRVVQPQLDLGLYLDWQEMPPLNGKTRFRRVGADYPDTEKDDGIVCPYGQPGDRLWVREAWRSAESLDHLSGSAMAEACLEAGYQRPWAPIEYVADGERVNWKHTGTPLHAGPPKPGRYRHGRFMPRWASRITLEVTGIRVERLQDISEADAIAEGLLPDRDGWRGAEDLPWFASPVAAYRSLWESINGAGSWDANPWVWVVEFRRIEQEATAR